MRSLTIVFFVFLLSLLQYLSVCLLSNYILRGFYATSRGMGGKGRKYERERSSMKERGVAWSVIDRKGEDMKEGKE
jgi:hypothetical protein